MRNARIAAGFETAAEAARNFEWREYTYRSHESGRRDFNPDDAAKSGRAFGAPPEWLLFGRGKAKAGRLVVASYVGAGAKVFPLGEAIDEIDPPPGMDAEAFAVIVRGDSMLPAFSSGDVLVAQWVEDPRDLIRKRAIVDLEDGSRFVKQVAPGSRPEAFTLLSHNAEPIFDAAIVRAARIVWIRPAA